MDNKQPKHIASVSWGKDSLAMLFVIIENELPLDEVVFYDTGMEFQAIYDTRDKVLPLLEEKGIKYTELHPDKPFEYYMFEKPVCKKGTKDIHKYGYSWCGGACRWGTTKKTQAIDRYCKDAIQFVQDQINMVQLEQAKQLALPPDELHSNKIIAFEKKYSDKISMMRTMFSNIERELNEIVKPVYIQTREKLNEKDTFFAHEAFTETLFRQNSNLLKRAEELQAEFDRTVRMWLSLSTMQGL